MAVGKQLRRLAPLVQEPNAKIAVAVGSDPAYDPLAIHELDLRRRIPVLPEQLESDRELLRQGPSQDLAGTLTYLRLGCRAARRIARPGQRGNGKQQPPDACGKNGSTNPSGRARKRSRSSAMASAVW